MHNITLRADLNFDRFRVVSYISIFIGGTLSLGEIV